MKQPIEFKVMTLRECPVADPICDTPDMVVNYWRQYVATDPRFNQDVETLVLICLNSRKRLTGHTVISTGTLDTILVHPREVFKPAIGMSAASIILMHNHPSGESSPSEADIKVTRDLIRCGQLLKIELCDHVIVGDAQKGKGYCSLRELGYFAY
jgi:DNA repair protein RadC